MNEAKDIQYITGKSVKVKFNRYSISAVINILSNHHVTALNKKPVNYSEAYAFNTIIIDTHKLINNLSKHIYKVWTSKHITYKFSKAESFLIMVSLKDSLSNNTGAYDVYTQIDKQMINFK